MYVIGYSNALKLNGHGMSVSYEKSCPADISILRQNLLIKIVNAIYCGTKPVVLLSLQINLISGKSHNTSPLEFKSTHVQCLNFKRNFT